MGVVTNLILFHFRLCAIIHRVVENGAGVADGDAQELDAFPISSEGANEGWYFSVFLVSFFLASEITSEADLKEDERVVIVVKGFGSGVGSAGTHWA